VKKVWHATLYIFAIKLDEVFEIHSFISSLNSIIPTVSCSLQDGLLSLRTGNV